MRSGSAKGAGRGAQSRWDSRMRRVGVARRIELRTRHCRTAELAPAPPAGSLCTLERQRQATADSESARGEEVRARGEVRTCITHSRLNLDVLSTSTCSSSSRSNDVWFARVCGLRRRAVGRVRMGMRWEETRPRRHWGALIVLRVLFYSYLLSMWTSTPGTDRKKCALERRRFETETQRRRRREDKIWV